MAPENNIARRATAGSLYTVAAAAATLLLGIVRTTLMLRLLLPEEFGVTALAMLYISLAIILTNFGFDQAFIHHRAVDETVRRTYFTLRTAASLTGLLLIGLLTPLIAHFYPDMPQLTAVMFAYLLVFVLRELNQTQLAILDKNLAFRQVAQIDVICSLVMTVVGPTLAWLGWGVWAIVCELLSGTGTRLFILQFIYRTWRPRLGWDWQQARWFWDYGKKAWHSSNIAYFLNRLDDWYVGTFLGGVALGYYSRAYEYAGYSQRIIANPIMSVFYPTFAHIQADRQKLSRAFFRPISLMIRSGSLFCLVFILTAPEFIPLFLGEKWLPMQRTFQLMIIYALLEPLNMGARNLLMATGYPRQVLYARIAQVVLFTPAVFLLGGWFGIEGVALAADLMVVVGTVLFFRYTRQVVDYSSRQLWLWPLAATSATAVLILALNPLWQSLNLWLSLGLKMALITAVYGLILFITEREQLNTGRKMIWGIIAPMLKERQEKKPDVS